MTTPYGPPAPARPAAPSPRTSPDGIDPRMRTGLRVLMAVVLIVLSTLTACGLALAGLLTASDCFIGCDPGSGDATAGTLLGALALFALLAGPVLARVMWRRTVTRPLTAWATVLLGGPVVMLLSGALHPLLPSF